MQTIAAALALALLAAPAAATDISTHVLDLVHGTGGRGVPVTLARQEGGAWREVGRAVTDADGRVRGFGPAERFGAGLYRLRFDVGAAPALGAAFFPEIVVTFRVAAATPHVHVPVSVSPFGYSTYRGN